MVITDIVMPDMDGLELAEWLRSEHPATTVPLLTGHPTPEGSMRAMQIGVLGYLIKPFTNEDLRACVRQLHGRHKELDIPDTSLERRLQLLEGMLDRVPIPMVVVDDAGRLAHVSRSAQALLTDNRCGQSPDAWETLSDLRCGLGRRMQQLLRETLGAGMPRHMSRSYAKTGTKGQSELVSLVLSSPALLVGLKQLEPSTG